MPKYKLEMHKNHLVYIMKTLSPLFLLSICLENMMFALCLHKIGIEENKTKNESEYANIVPKFTPNARQTPNERDTLSSLSKVDIWIYSLSMSLPFVVLALVKHTFSVTNMRILNYFCFFSSMLDSYE